MGIATQLKDFFTHPIFLSCVFSWLGAQFIKTVLNLIYGKIKSFGSLMENMFWRTGGMPSSHSALVAALATSIGIRNGTSSDIFLLALAFFFVTIRDAVGVRRASGMQARKLNEVGNELKNNGNLKEYKSIKEIHGHTPLQVMLGCLLGFLISLSFNLLK